MYSRDWLDNKELRRCSPAARGVLADLMCLAHEGTPYGHLADDIGPLTDEYMASRCVVPISQFRSLVAELIQNHRIERAEGGCLFDPRMVRDEQIRVARAEGGKRSVGHPHTHPPNGKEGYPYTHPSLSNRGGVRSDSVSVSDSGFDFESWFSARMRKHPIPGKPQIAQQYAIDKITIGKLTPSEFDASHDAWCEYWKTQEGGIPTLATFIYESWYERKPPETKRKLSAQERVIEEAKALVREERDRGRKVG